MNVLATFKKDVLDFLKIYGMSKTALGQEACGNPHTIFRILQGGENTKVSTMQAVYDFMDRYIKERRKK